MKTLPLKSKKRRSLGPKKQQPLSSWLPYFGVGLGGIGLGLGGAIAALRNKNKSPVPGPVPAIVDEIRQLKEDKTELEKEVTRLLKDKTELEKVAAGLLKDKTDLEKEAAGLLKDKTDLEKEALPEIRQLKEEVTRLLKDKTDLEKEVARLTQDKADLEQVMRAANDVVQAKLSGLAQINQNMVDEAKENSATITLLIAQLRKKDAEKEAELAALKQELKMAQLAWEKEKEKASVVAEAAVEAPRIVQYVALPGWVDPLDILKQIGYAPGDANGCFTFDKFQINKAKYIAEGSYGKTYEACLEDAKKTKDCKYVAKIVEFTTPDTPVNAAALSMTQQAFALEATIGYKCGQEGIGPAVLASFFCDRGQKGVIIMQRLGDSLTRWQRKHRLTRQNWQRMWSKLQAMYEIGILHNDLNATNMMVVEDEKLPTDFYVIDFGFAVLCNANTTPKALLSPDMHMLFFGIPTAKYDSALQFDSLETRRMAWQEMGTFFRLALEVPKSRPAIVQQLHYRLFGLFNDGSEVAQLTDPEAISRSLQKNLQQGPRPPTNRIGSYYILILPHLLPRLQVLGLNLMQYFRYASIGFGVQPQDQLNLFKVMCQKYRPQGISEAQCLARLQSM